MEQKEELIDRCVKDFTSVIGKEIMTEDKINYLMGLFRMVYLSGEINESRTCRKEFNDLKDEFERVCKELMNK
jgi:hypothetical protein